MKRWLIIIAVALLVLTPLGIFGFWPIVQDTTAKVSRTYTIDVPLMQTYAKLAPPDVVKKIVVLGNSKFISEEHEDPGLLGLGLGGLRGVAHALRDHSIERHSILTVETNDSYIGKQVIRLEQDSTISMSELISNTHLLEAKGRLRAYDCASTIHEVDGKTVISSTLTMTIRTQAPRLFRWVPQRRVNAAAELRLKLLEEAFREVIGSPIVSEEATPPTAHFHSGRRQMAIADWRKRRFAA